MYSYLSLGAIYPKQEDVIGKTTLGTMNKARLLCKIMTCYVEQFPKDPSVAAVFLVELGMSARHGNIVPGS